MEQRAESRNSKKRRSEKPMIGLGMLQIAFINHSFPLIFRTFALTIFDSFDFDI